MTAADYAVEALEDYDRACRLLGGDVLDGSGAWMTRQLQRFGRLAGLEALDRVCVGRGGVREAMVFEGARRAGASDNDLIGMAERRMTK